MGRDMIATLAAEPRIIDAPGIYDLTDVEYHGDPVPGRSLSSGGARRLVPPSCPAEFAYWRNHGEDHKAEFDLGHAAHMLVLGVGLQIAPVDAKDWKTKAAQEQRAAAYEAGKVPLLTADHDAVKAMAEALYRHRRAADLLNPLGGGLAEQSLFWVDPDTDVWCRARPDWLSDAVVDYKTTTGLSDDQISRAVASHGYHQQADFYLTGGVELDLIPPDAPFYFIFQSKNPPYLVRVIELDETALRVGAERNRMALEIYRDCEDADLWPDFGDDIDTVRLPRWAVYRHMEETF